MSRLHTNMWQKENKMPVTGRVTEIKWQLQDVLYLPHICARMHVTPMQRHA